jgi:hypothetical protein
MTRAIRQEVGGAAAMAKRLWKAFVFGVICSIVASVAVFVLGWILLAFFGPEPAYTGDPNDGAGLALLGFSMVAGNVGFLVGAVYRFVRGNRQPAVPGGSTA